MTTRQALKGFIYCQVLSKVIIEKSRGEGSLMEQDTIEYVEGEQKKVDKRF